MAQKKKQEPYKVEKKKVGKRTRTIVTNTRTGRKTNLFGDVPKSKAITAAKKWERYVT